ncbi:lipopolysaccharide heptosyltransferase I [Uliginosibacterium sediminicola]|uniref:Lipopolysaccharide heptosyltransferase 1 n=1 Tax=Uliginosibacterium sediminicola TaxID=2024550 RepID=A0ABU9Z2H3_9RHOO
MRSVLLVKTSSMGDVIHNLPVVSDLRRMWPQLAIDWVVEESFAEIPRLHPGVRRVIPVALRRWRKALAQGRTWREIGAARRALGEQYYDFIIDTQGLVKSALISRFAGGLRCGYTRGVAREGLAALAYDCRYAIPRSAHAVERNRWLAAAACEYPLDLPLRYGLQAPAALPAWLPTGDYAVLLTATSRDDKLWPEAHWIALGHALAARGLRSVLPAGNAREFERAARLAAAIPDAVAAPRASLSELASVLQSAHCVIGVDTGLTHLATALDRPVVALAVSTDPALTGVHGGRQAINLGGIGQIPAVDSVLASLHPWLP